MDKLIHYQFLLSFVVCICAKVEWKVEEKISAYGEDLRLFCTTEDYSVNGGKIKRWEGGPKQKMLTLNGAPDQEDVMKYNMSMREDGFILVIKNVTKVDLNVTYECTYGFKTSGKVVLQIEDAFEEGHIAKPIKRESEETDNVTIYVIIVLVLVIAAVTLFIMFILHKKGKLKGLKYICGGNENSVQRHDRDSDSEEPQETYQFTSQPNGFGNHHSNGDLPSRGPQETDQFITLPNGFVNHHSNGDVKEANEYDSIPSQQIMGHGEQGNTELICEILVDTSLEDVTTLKDLASSTFTEVNECDILPQQQNAGHKQEYKEEDVSVFVSMPSNQSVLVKNVTGSDAEYTFNTAPASETSEDISPKDVTIVKEPGHAKFSRAYKIPNTREKSFKSQYCKWTLSQPSIQQMAKAGFFCSGYETIVQCYSCGEKRHWQEGDDPFDEQFHNNCQHLKHIKRKQASGEGS